MLNPLGPSFGPDGKFYVGDSGTNRVLRYDSDGVFIDVFADKSTSGLDKPAMQTYDNTSMYISSGGTNSILRYDLKTNEFLGAFVKPGSGGLVTPVGLEFGPDGNLYASSSGTDSILRYDGKTGEFIDEFVPSGSGGLDNPRAIRFGGPNSDLYVVSSNTNKVLRYDRTTGEFLGMVIDGTASEFTGIRGLTFSPRPEFFISVSPTIIYEHKSFERIKVQFTKLQDFTDPDPKVELVSITVNDSTSDIKEEVKNAKFGTNDTSFFIKAENRSDVDKIYTITYRATNSMGATMLATAKFTILAEGAGG